MAFQEDFKDENKQPGQPISAPSYVGAGVPGAGAGSASPSSAASQRGGSGFVNLIDYVKANEGQGPRMAGDVVRPISQDMVTTNARQGQLQGLSEGIKYNTDKGYNSLLDSVTKQQDAIKRVTGKVDALSQPSSLEEGLKSAYGGPERRYTQGQNTLDSFIAGSGGGKEVLGQTVAGFGKLDLARRNEDLLNNLRSLKPAAVKPKESVVTSAPPTLTGEGKPATNVEQYTDFTPNNFIFSPDVTQKPLNIGVEKGTEKAPNTILGGTSKGYVPRVGEAQITTLDQVNRQGPVSAQTEQQKAAQRAKIQLGSNDYSGLFAALGL